MNRPLLVTSLLLTALALGLVWELIGEAPPQRLSIAAGPRDGGYYALAQRLAARLRTHGIAVDVLETNGAVDNLRALSQREGPMFGLVQGGTRPGRGVDTGRLRTLATVDLEPVFIFSRRSDPPVVSIEQFSQRRLIGGRNGSGTRDLLQLLLSTAKIAPSAPVISLSNADAARALRSGDGEIVFSVVRWDQQGWVARLLRTGDVVFAELGEADALARNFSFLANVDLPAGTLDVARRIPQRDIKLLATATNLVVRADAHAALKVLMLEELATIDHGTRVLGTDGRFPNLAYAELPADPEAVTYFKKGPSLFRRYLPYWLATVVERFYALLLPLATLALPLFRLVPQWLARRRQQHLDDLYHKLEDIDIAVAEARGKPVETRIQLSRLKHFERDLTFVQRRRLGSDRFLQFRRDIDRIRNFGEGSLQSAVSASTANGGELPTTIDFDLASGHGDGVAEPKHASSADDLLARMQDDLESLAALRGAGRNQAVSLTVYRRLDALSQRLNDVRRALVQSTSQDQSRSDVGASPPPGRDDRFKPVAGSIEQIAFAERAPSRAPEPLKREAPRSPYADPQDGAQISAVQANTVGANANRSDGTS